MFSVFTASKQTQILSLTFLNFSNYTAPALLFFCTFLGGSFTNRGNAFAAASAVEKGSVVNSMRGNTGSTKKKSRSPRASGRSGGRNVPRSVRMNSGIKSSRNNGRR